MKQKNPFTIIYEDDRIVAVNKISGIAISPDRWDESKERLDRLVSAFLNLERIYTVHRIDRDTSGLIVFAKDEETHKLLSEAFENRSIHKRYIAVINGRPSWEEIDCNLALVPNGNKQHHTIVDKFKGKKSLTHFRLLGSAGNYSVIEAIPETGRTHQIRVHLANLGYPIVCDEFYGNAKPVFLSAIKRGWRGNPLDEKPLLTRLGLHAAELFIPDYSREGAEKEGLNLKAPLPRDMAALVNQMEKTAGGSFGV
ncbi:RluA family pseudouridine synthase [Leadbettera azotonutricia]|uniref:Ribosomal large subunit pseudouridine synthase A n=1 Tax=Leadbettera azotonutricia (strain ATCC BAA-888 / DSM 13862 / ZAS-9) TaxID=545695 RepID=F5Y9D1_LEAAZ|nr:RluA family pseudouridine synthase [Leadbettera azotonutricia]AEF82181.1 ribosomal large subunit pseudouridine synthase A [Leadbettera azotonutricia ZAS-9]